MKATTKRRTKNDAQLLDYATNNLLMALKRDMADNNQKIESAGLCKAELLRKRTRASP